MKTFTLLSIAVFTCCNLAAQQQDSARLYFNKGLEETAAKHYLIAAKYFDRAISFDSKFTDAYIANGNVNLSMRRVDVALTNFIKANQVDPLNTVAINELSSLYFNNRQFEKAIDMARQCKDCADADKIIAMSYYQLEDYAKAASGLIKALEKNPRDAEICYTLGRAYLELEDDRNAIAYYQKAVDIDTAKNVWMYELGLMYYNSDKYKEALSCFLKAANFGYPKSNDFYENTGFAYLYTNDVENGIKNLSVVLSRKPGNVTLLSDIAQAMYRTKHYNQALNYYQQLLTLNAKDARTLYMAGITFQKMGEKEKGQAMCDNAIAMDPSLAEKRQKKGEQFGL